jgi:hypothetical protein
VSSNSKVIAKLRKKFRKYPRETGLNGFKAALLKLLPAFIILWLLRNVLVRSDYKLKRESTKFFRFCSDAYGSNKRRRCRRLLVIAFGLIDQELNINYVALIKNSVQSTLNDTRIRSKLSEIILESTKRLEILKLDATGWYQLSRGLFSLGYFRAAWVARENSLDSSISEAVVSDPSSTCLERGIQAYLERVNLSRTKEILSECGAQLSSKDFSHFQNFVAMFERNYNYWPKVGGIQNRKNEDLFRDLITGKTVAVVGPGTPQNDYGLEIDGFDTVIRIKFIGNVMRNDRSYHGIKTDVTFIGSVSVIKLQEESLEKDFATFQLIMSNRTSVDSICSVPIYEIEDDEIIYRTPTTSGIRTLKEVIKYSPSKVKVFGFDFYSTSTPYSKEMTEFYENSSWRLGHPNDFVADGVYFKYARARDLLIHDPVSNFCFAQNLYKAGLFDIEPYGKSILELTPYQYVERLEEMLGDW